MVGHLHLSKVEISLALMRLKLHLHVDEQSEKRNKSLDLSKFVAKRGYHKLYMDHVLQADKGSILIFLFKFFLLI